MCSQTIETNVVLNDIMTARFTYNIIGSPTLYRSGRVTVSVFTGGTILQDCPLLNRTQMPPDDLITKNDKMGCEM